MRESVKITTERCTTDLMEHLRYANRVYLLADELKYNGTIMDVCAIDETTNPSTVREYEVKVSLLDFKHDAEKVIGKRRFGGVQLKHYSYNNPTDKFFAPHLFYYVVPRELVEEVLPLLEKYPKYGLLSWDPEGVFKKGRKGRILGTKINMVKKAKRIPKTSRGTSSETSSIHRIKQKVIQRASSSLVLCRLSRTEARKKEDLRKIKDTAESVVYLLYKLTKSERICWSMNKAQTGLISQIGPYKVQLKDRDGACCLEGRKGKILDGNDLDGDLINDIYKSLVKEAKERMKVYSVGVTKDKGLNNNKELLEVLRAEFEGAK